MDIATEFLEQSRHYLAVEYPTKIRHCLDALPPDAVWRRSDEQSNSIGNLLLHLDGNVRQWIVSSVGGAPDTRYRAAEFAARQGATVDDLFAALRSTLDQADGVLASLPATQLLTRRTIQGRDVTVFDAVYHVVEHFSLHTGQIILLTKLYAPGRITFYEDAGGLAIPRWREGR
ncbi:MAG TPA: DinB family protein [Gemmatimonadaceae bacterium]|nr:DinB family protein [Gemmatimonadaceae bacterium]